MGFRLQIKLDKRGDTIIEVMLALAVLGAIIGGGYSVATRSLNGVRISQERGEATKLAEGQLEALKATFSGAKNITDLFVDDSLGDLDKIFNQPVYKIPIAVDKNSPSVNAVYPGVVTTSLGFCYNPSGEIRRFVRPDGLAVEDINGPIPFYSGTGCVYDNLYHVYIDLKYEVISTGGPSDVTELTYNINVTWNRSGGGGVEQLVLNERVRLGL